MSWSGANIEKKQEDIDRTLESKVNEVEMYERRLDDVLEKLEAIEYTLAHLSEDATLKETLEDNRKNRERERLDEKQYAESLQSDLEYLLVLVREGEESADRDSDALASLRAIGEDVSEAEGIVAARIAWAEQTQRRIEELIARIGGKTTEPMTRLTASRRLSSHIDHGNPTSSSGRYVSPGDMVAARYQALVETFGPTNPAGWIDAGNPLHNTGELKWMENCGSCARSFAETFHGKSAEPAMGDSRFTPGEYHEMWEALGVRPESQMTNKHADQALFQESAYQAVAASLRREGTGAVAIIGVDWDLPGVERGRGGGHWFNAYVDHDGSIKWADMQTGKLADWPPRYTSPIWRIEAVVRSSAESPWKELVL